MKYHSLFIALLLSTCAIHGAEVAIHMPTCSPRELAEKVCKIMNMEGNEKLKSSIEDLFTEKKPSPEQLKRRENIIRKISESEE